MAATAFSRLVYDVRAYEQAVRQSSAPGEYVLGAFAASHCDACHPSDARVAAGTGGVAACPGRALVDVDSDLMGLTRPLTKDADAQYRPGAGAAAGAAVCPGTAGGGAPPRPLKPCARPAVEDTRLSNPTSTLRGTGWNRWEWLCQDPQARALVPFDTNINYRLVARDNHRPHLPRPLDQTLALPPGARHDEPPAETRWWREGACIGQPTGASAPADMSWRSCDEITSLRRGAVAAACAGRSQ